MLAPNLSILFNLEPAVEGAWKTLLSRGKIKGFTSRETEKLPLNRVDIQATVGAATGHMRPMPGGKNWFDAWKCQVVLGIVTERRAIDPSGEHSVQAEPWDPLDRHNQIRARIRILAQYAQRALNEDVLPFHSLYAVMDGGATNSVVTVDDCDVSEITLDCEVCIRANAWPADIAVLGTPDGEVIDLGGGIVLQL